MFEFVTNVVYPSEDKVDTSIIKRLRKKLLHDGSRIETKNPGAGSSGYRKRLKTVRQVVATIGLPGKYGKLIGRTAAYFKVPYIIELGTGTGLSTLYLAKYNPGAEVITIDANNEMVKLAERNFERAGVDNIRVVVGEFDSVFPEILDNIDTNFMVYIDGNHTREATLRYMNILSKKAGNSTVVVIDDIYWSKDMNEAWDTIKQMKHVKVTADFYRIGMVFFKEGLSRENFVIKYK